MAVLMAPVALLSGWVLYVGLVGSLERVEVGSCYYRHTADIGGGGDLGPPRVDCARPHALQAFATTSGPFDPSIVPGDTMTFDAADDEYCLAEFDRRFASHPLQPELDIWMEKGQDPFDPERYHLVCFLGRNDGGLLVGLVET